MRFLHTSDLHIGKKLGKFSLNDIHSEFFDFLYNICEEKDINVVFFAGDIFNVPSPDFLSERVFYEGINRLSNNGKRVIIISAGNHDSAKKIDVASALGLDKGIIFIPTISSLVNNGNSYKNDYFEIFDIEEGAFRLKINDEIISVINLGCPTEENINFYRNNYEKVKEASNYQSRVFEILSSKDGFFKEETFNFFMGHIYLNGTFELTDSETNYNIGGLYSVDSRSIPKLSDYIALGHLHKKQQVKSSNNAFYSGSPFAFSKSEANNKKYVICGEFDSLKKLKLEEIEVKISKKTSSLVFKSLDEMIASLKEKDFLDTYVYLELKDNNFYNPDYIEKSEEILKYIEEIELLVDFEVREKSEEENIIEYAEDFELFDVFTKLAKEQIANLDDEKIVKYFDLYNDMLKHNDKE